MLYTILKRLIYIYICINTIYIYTIYLYITIIYDMQYRNVLYIYMHVPWYILITILNIYQYYYYYYTIIILIYIWLYNTVLYITTLYYICIHLYTKLVDPAGCSYAPWAQRLSHASGSQPDGLNKCLLYYILMQLQTAV